MHRLSTEEVLARYILTKRYYNPTDQSVKRQVFMPVRNQQTSILETSVYRVLGLPDKEIWNIGEREVAQKSHRNLHGRADIGYVKVLEKGLDVKPDEIPPRHANIIGWPEEESRKMMTAIEIAADAKLHLK